MTSDRFGPSQQDYVAVQAYFEQQGFTVTEGSANRLTLTVSGTRAQAQSALDVQISDYRIGNKTFYANNGEPSLPGNLAPYVQAVSGLSNLATPQSLRKQIVATSAA